LECIKSPQGAALLLGTFSAGLAGLPLMMNAKLIVTDVFASSASPELLGAAPIAAYVGGLSLGSTAGRLILGPLSDATGRLRMYGLMGALQAPAIALLPYLATQSCYGLPVGASSLDPDTALKAFMAASCASVFVYGGYTAMLPPVVSDIFGNDRVGVVFPRVFAMLNVASTSGTAAFSRWRAHATERACTELTDQVRQRGVVSVCAHPIRS
jgi:MFS family permease